MPISFIITTYNILPYLSRCLQSVASVARGGDEVIIVDDGSTDGSAEFIGRNLDQFRFECGVVLQPVCLGTNTIGGVGIPANIGLSLATRDTIFFVDGDDWIEVSGFKHARAQLALKPVDMLTANYQVFDERTDTYSPPADAERWNRLVHNCSIENMRLQSLTLIGVPWRKFYSREFLIRNKLTFPEGKFFYEDNPFHWATSLAAESISFHNIVVCSHRVNRPGQTMEESGIALLAFFDHFDTIKKMAVHHGAEYQIMAINWLIGNMTWHVKRLSSHAYFPYALRATLTLAAINEELWTTAMARQSDPHPIWFVAMRLRHGDIAGQVSAWENEKLNYKLEELDKKLSKIASVTKSSLDRLRGQDASDIFSALHGAFNK